MRCARCAHTWQSPPPEPPDLSVEAGESAAPMAAAVAEVDPVFAPPGTAAPFGPKDDDESPAPGPIIRNLPALREQRSIANAIGWAALLLLLAGVGLGLYFGRERIVAFWPPAARLYEVVSVGVEPENKFGLELRNLNFSMSDKDGTPVLDVVGEVINITPQMRAVPRIRIALRNADAEEIYQWTAQAKKESLPPGSVTRFSTSLDNPPVEARDMSVTFLAEDLGKSE